MISGWILLHKKFMDWEWYNDINVKVLFIHCLLKANYTDKKFKGKIIKRGQFFTSFGNLSKEIGLSVKQVRTAIKKLELSENVAHEGASNGIMITVLKYDSYQDLKNIIGKQRGKQGASKGQQLNKNKEKERNIYRHFAHLEISIEENKKLIQLGYSQNMIDDIYNRIENYSGNKKYKSLYLTALNWLKRENQQSNQADFIC